MNEHDLIRALERYIASSSRRDSLTQTVRLSQLEPSILKYLESKISIANSKEIHRVERIIVRLDERIKRLENPFGFEEFVGSIVMKKIVAITAIIGGIVAFAAFIISILKY